MVALARQNAHNRHYRCLRKKRKIKRKSKHLTPKLDTHIGTFNAFLTLLCLVGVFIVLVYFHAS